MASYGYDMGGIAIRISASHSNPTNAWQCGAPAVYEIHGYRYVTMAQPSILATAASTRTLHRLSKC